MKNLKKLELKEINFVSVGFDILGESFRYLTTLEDL